MGLPIHSIRQLTKQFLIPDSFIAANNYSVMNMSVFTKLKKQPAM